MGAFIPLIVAFLGAIVCLGWMADIEFMKCAMTEQFTMGFTTALMFTHSGLLLWLVRIVDTRRPQWQRYLAAGNLFALLVLCVGSLFPAVIHHPGIEVFFPCDAKCLATDHTGLPSIGTLLCFTMVASAGVVAIIHETNALRTRNSIGVILIAIGTLAIFGYVIETPCLYWYSAGRSTAMAMHTACTFVLLGVAILTTPFYSKYERGSWK